ncbi:MAG: zinc ribbon domain-containing protein [Halieaceae bacterium]
MTTSSKMQSRMKLNRPSVRNKTRPPKQRTPLGETFTAANLPAALSLQHCGDCGQVQYPPRELCHACLGDLVWRETSGSGVVSSRVDLHHSLWEFFKRHTAQQPWPIASIKLDCGPTVLAHVDLDSFGAAGANDVAAGTPVQVFSHSDCSQQAILIMVAASEPIATADRRHAIADRLGLLEPALKPGGI